MIFHVKHTITKNRKIISFKEYDEQIEDKIQPKINYVAKGDE